MKAPALVGIVAAFHILGITALVSIQGCGTTRTTRVTPMPVDQPPPPTMPPKATRPGMQPPTFSTRPTPAPTAVVVDTANLAGTSYTIKKGDTLSHVAKRHGVGTRDLAEYNGLTNLNSLKIGQKVVIPPYAKGPSSARSTSAPRASAPSARPAAVSAVAGTGSYVVQAGDNLSKIAKRKGTSVAALKKVNNLSNDRILVGQKLVLPKGVGSGAATVTSVASAPRVTTPRAPTMPPRSAVRPVTAEVDASSLDLESLSIESIDVPRDAGASAVSIPAIQEKPILYTVVDGDSVEEIAKLFIVSKGEILKLNNLSDGAELTPGQTIRIPPSAL